MGVRSAFAEVESMAIASGRYCNFPEFAEDPVHLLFGDNYDRLVDVKTKYDPENRFHNIEPAE